MAAFTPSEDAAPGAEPARSPPLSRPAAAPDAPGAPDPTDVDAAGALAALVADTDRRIGDGLALAGPFAGGPPAASPGRRNFVLFVLAGTRCALPIESIAEVTETPAVTPVPGLPSWLRGVTNLRGEVLAVIDLKLFLGFGAAAGFGDGADGADGADAADAAGAAAGRMLVFRLDADLNAGLLVDAVAGMAALDARTLSLPTAPVADRVARFLRGTTERNGSLVAVLDPARLARAVEILALRA